MTQEALATALGFENRQTLASVEAGERPLSSAELVSAARALNVAVDRLVDPFQLVEEGEFNFRATGDVDQGTVREFQNQAGAWVATYRELAAQEGLSPKTLGMKLELLARPSFEEIQTAAESMWKQWELGDTPATKLEGAIESRLGVLVLYVDAPAGVSGAAVHLPGLQAILVNRAEPEGRRHFDLAHELFHILTWDVLRPDWIDLVEPKRVKGSRVEQLANNFAAALLMPSPVIDKCWRVRDGLDLAEWMAATAEALRVSTVALGWRLVNLGMLAQKALHDLLELCRPATQRNSPTCPRLFSAVFVERVHHAVEGGRLSLSRAAMLLNLSIREFAALCCEYGKSLSYELNDAT